MLTVEKAAIHLFILIVPIATEKVSRIRSFLGLSLLSNPTKTLITLARSNIIWNRWKVEGNTRISRTRTPEFVTMNEHAIANVYRLDLIFQLGIMFVKNILLQISFCA